jgi:hypothetical protein
MAAANDSQGLKIAVAAFVSLAVILAVTSYFLYSSYSQADAQRLTALDDASKKAAAADLASREREEMVKAVGSRGSDIDAVRAEVKAEQKKVDDEIAGLVQTLNDSIAKAQAAGATGPELQDAKDKLNQISAAYLSEPNKNYISSMNRLKDLIKNVALIDQEISRNYVTLKRGLESANDTNQQKLDVETGKFDTAKTDLDAEHKKHGEERETLVARLDQLQTENGKQAADIASLSTKLRELQDESTKKLETANQIIRELRDFKDASENVLDRPDGYVTYVDYGRGEIRTNLTRAMGARPQMKMSIFDRNAPGVPTEKPKGTVELVQVGETYSIARIVKTFDPVNSIRTGDIVYSPSWSPNEPMRFALIGRIDVNRDGKDDRADLKRMIEATGGIVDYDLPPPEAGKETGKLSARVAWYVTDERMPLNLEGYAKSQKSLTMNESAEFLRKKSEAVREARINGVRPMPIERLLSYLGYDYGAKVVGRAEAVDRNALNLMLRGRSQTKPATPTTPTEENATPPAEEKKEETPKEEMPKEENK